MCQIHQLTKKFLWVKKKKRKKHEDKGKKLSEPLEADGLCNISGFSAFFNSEENSRKVSTQDPINKIKTFIMLHSSYVCLSVSGDEFNVFF